MMFSGVYSTKTVTVKVPAAGLSAYGTTPFDNSDTTTANWGNGFRGGGWDGNYFISGGIDYINITITLNIVEYDSTN
jgi:hypothetical protein